MRIAILGTRGIPNNHGGFEQFAEYLSVFLVERGHEVYVYNSSDHPYQDNIWNNVNIIHCYDPEGVIGTAGQFVYDFNCIMNSRKLNFDLILQLGYTSSSIWNKLMPKEALVVTNMDGLEWRRSKYNKLTQKFLKYAESLAIKSSDYLISDSIGIQKYIKETYNKDSFFLAYGANVFLDPKIDVLEEYKLSSFNYNLLIARLEPENNIETILDGVVLSGSEKTFLVIGKHETKYGEFLKKKYFNSKNINFLGGIYNQDHLNNLRYFSNIYFHGHSVGGTNPSLLEAMASNSFIIANDNVFNRSILGDDAFYFENKEDVSLLLNSLKKDYLSFVENNVTKIKEKYNWEFINSSYEKYLTSCL